jgi:CHAT domain-containing protein
MVLGPVAGHLARRRLLVVSDGALQYVPFGALYTPTTGSRPRTPLIVEHEIVSLPSASALAVQRQELAAREPADRLLAVLADPVLGADDARVRRAARAAGGPPTAEPVAQLDRSAREIGIARFERLPFTRKEADAITGFVRQRQTLKAVDFDASRGTLMDPALDRYQVIHLATHGILNSVHPELSGIVLSLVDRDGRPQDGFVRAHEIFNLKLGARLVVLSACRTALGKEIRGEGLVGLVRGFMYAGAARVVASLWDVRDEATAALMTRFYEGMLKRGLTPAGALRAAQVSMWRDTRWEAPYYWAGFVMQGEWK